MGTLFIRLLTMLVTPLVATSIIGAIARFGEDSSLKRLSFKTILIYFFTTVCALGCGLLVVNFIRPGEGYPQEYFTTAITTSAAPSFSKNILQQFLLQVVPKNIFYAFAHGQMMAIILFSTFFGIALSQIDQEKRLLFSRFFYFLVV